MSSREGFVVWLTGLPASGKSTLARELSRRLAARRISTQIVDSDEIREILTPEPTYSLEEKVWFYEVLALLTDLLTSNGVNVIIAATGNLRTYRDTVCSRAPRLTIVHVRCPLEIAMERDDKGVYEKGLSGESDTVPGIGQPYEDPVDPDVVVETDELSPGEGAKKILTWMESNRFVVERKG